MMMEPKDGFLTLVAANELLTDKTVKYKVTDLSDNTLLFEDESVVGLNNTTVLNKLPQDKEKTHFYLLEWEYDGIKGKNHYLSGKAPYDFKQYVSWLKQSDLI